MTEPNPEDTSPSPRSRGRRLGLFALYGIVSVLVLVTLFSVGTRLAVRYVDNHPEILRDWLAEHWQAQVQLGDVAVASNQEVLRVTVKDFVAQDSAGATFVAAKRLYVELDWWQSLQTLQPVTNVVEIDNPQLQLVHHRDGHFSVGKAIAFGQTPSDGSLSRWFLRQKDIRMQHARLSLYSEKLFETWQVSGASLHLHREDEQHSMNLKVPKVGEQGTLDVQMQWQGDLTDTWSGVAAIEASQLPLDALGPIAQSPHLSVQKSLVGMHGVLRWEENRLQASQAQVKIHDTVLYNRHSLQTIHLPAFPITVEGVAKDGVLYTNVNAALPAYNGLPEETITAHATISDEALHFSLPNFSLVELQYFLPWFATTALQEKFAAMQPQGSLHNTVLSVPLKQSAAFSARTRFTQVALKPAAPFPGASAFDGELLWAGNTINVGVQSEDFSLNHPEVFAKPLLLGKVTANVRAQFAEKGWELSAEQVNISPPFGDVSASLRMHALPDNPKPFIELSGKFRAHRVDSLKNYLPTQRLKPNFVRWFSQAFEKGKVTQGTLSLHGDLNHYPFQTKDQGVFQLELQAEDASLKFHPDWQRLENIDATLKINQQHLQVHANKASLAGHKITQAKFWMDDLKQKPAVMHVTAKAQGEASEIQKFLADSPLKQYIGQPLAALEVKGAVQGELALDIVGKAGKPFVPPRVRGQVFLQNNHLSVRPIHLAMQQVTGVLEFSEKHIQAVGVKGQTLGGPVQLSVTTTEPFGKAGGKVQIQAKGQAAAKSLQQWAEFPLPKLAGRLHWQGEAQLGKKDNQVQVTADLRKASVQLPDMINKKVGQKMSAKLSTQWNTQRTKVDFSLGKQLRGKLLKPRQSKHWRGGLAAGRSLVAGKKELVIRAKLKTLNLDAWQDWLESQTKQSTTPAAMRLDVQADKVSMGQSHYAQVHAKARRQAKGWMVEMVSKELSGSLRIPDAKKQAMKLRLHAYRTRSASASAQKKISETFLERPIHVSVDSLFIDAHPAGRLSLTLMPNAQGMALQNILLQDRQMRVTGAGQWQRKSRQTRLNLRVKSKQLIEVLKKFSYTGNIQRAALDTSLHLHWPGAPNDFALSRLGGQAKLAIGPGLLEDIDASSGKVFGLMGLHTLGRRLRADWKDLDKGLDFDWVKGTFHLRNGVASTKETKLGSSTVNITFSGRTNLVHQTMHFDVDVRPRLSDTLPVVGAATAGLPGAIVGGALAVIDKITNHGVDKSARRKYTLSGSWKAPKVVQHKRRKPQEEVEKDPVDIF